MAAARARWRAIVPLVVAAGVAVVPAPGGLTPDAWRYFALFAGVVTALITEPLPGPVIGLIGITIAASLRLVAVSPADSIRWALSGFADSTVWLMFVAFMFALGYARTGLGRRIALVLVRWLGRRTLGLGYAVALADLALAPFIPSNTARSGGIVFPIVESLPALYGSAPGPTARRIGAYLMWTSFASMCVTSSMFLTALAPNLLAASLMREVARTRVTWGDWFVGFLPVGLLLFALAPWLAYVVYPPTLRASAEVPRWAGDELAKMGPMTRRERLMALTALAALVLWISGGAWINATAVALLALCAMILTGVVRWDDMLAHTQAWSALVWFAALITLAEGLGRVGFLRWFASGTTAALGGVPATGKLVLIVVVFFAAHYMFASLTAHATALMPPFLAAVVAVPDLPAHVLAHALAYTLGLMGVLNPYATGSAPIYFGSGYLTRRAFWTLGLLFGAIYLAALLAIGVPWLRALHPR